MSSAAHPIRIGIPHALEALASALVLAVLSPLLLIAASAVAFSSPGPVIFRQQRVGRGGRLFTLYKFRTMHVQETGGQLTARGDKRITNVGKILRYTKVDELPGLWNVVKGEMSLVGPRPEVQRFVDLTNPLWRSVLEVRPGLTDPVTLRLRNEEVLLAEVRDDREGFYLSVLQPFKLKGYLDYLNRRTFWSDVKVLYQTLAAVVLPGSMPPPSLTEISTLASVNTSTACVEVNRNGIEHSLL